MVAGLIVLMLCLRIIIDVTFPDEKPSWAIAASLGPALILLAAQVLRSNLSRMELLGCFALVSSCLANLFWIPGGALPQLYFSSQVLFPVIFLLTFSQADPHLLYSVRHGFLRIGVPILTITLLIFSVRQPVGQDLISYLNENPFHVVAQTIAKSSIILLGTGLLLPVLSLIVLAIFNVRSAFLGYLLAFMVYQRQLFLSWKMIGISLFAGALLIAAASQVEGFLQRLIWRDRTFLEADLSNITSGRTEIWSYYLDMIERSNLLELLLGRGAVWLYGEFRLMAHNDLLNLLVAYGIIGTLVMCAFWYVLLSRIASAYRLPATMLFLVLFATNGVVFHQSNILFVLYFAGSSRKRDFQAPPLTLANQAAWQSACAKHR
jgi:O-antigen ligase